MSPVRSGGPLFSRRIPALSGHIVRDTPTRDEPGTRPHPSQTDQPSHAHHTLTHTHNNIVNTDPDQKVLRSHLSSTLILYNSLSLPSTTPIIQYNSLPLHSTIPIMQCTNSSDQQSSSGHEWSGDNNGDIVCRFNGRFDASAYVVLTQARHAREFSRFLFVKLRVNAIALLGTSVFAIVTTLVSWSGDHAKIVVFLMV